jgi:hypothetical protein
VTIVDAAVLRTAGLRYLDEGPSVELELSGTAEDDDLPDLREQIAESAAAALEWLIWPTEGLHQTGESGAFRILSMETEVDEHSASRCTVTWTVTVKLIDVPVLREIAKAACPDGGEEIGQSLAAAWHHAAEPYAPLRSIPGITWQPGSVTVDQIIAQSNRS